MIKTIIFDMDGTLFQTNTILEAALEDTFQSLKAAAGWEGDTPVEQYRNLMGAPLPEVWEALLPHYSEQLRQQANDYFHERLIWNIKNGNGKLYPYAEQVLSFLKGQGYTLYIASNGLIDYLQAIVDYYRLDQWVSKVYSIEHLRSLDKTDLVRTIITENNCREAAVVGDRLSDIRAAKCNDLVAVGCHFDFAQTEELAQAHLVIKDLLELEALVRESAIS